MPEQLTLHLGRCQIMNRHGDQCTRWEGHRGDHAMFAPSSWHPDYAITLGGVSNWVEKPMYGNPGPR